MTREGLGINFAPFGILDLIQLLWICLKPRKGLNICRFEAEFK